MVIQAPSLTMHLWMAECRTRTEKHKSHSSVQFRSPVLLQVVLAALRVATPDHADGGPTFATVSWYKQYFMWLPRALMHGSSVPVRSCKAYQGLPGSTVLMVVLSCYFFFPVYTLSSMDFGRQGNWRP